MQTTYYLVRFDSFEPQKDYETMLSLIKTYAGMSVVEESETMATLRMEGAPNAIGLSVMTGGGSPLNGSGATLKVECEATDEGAMNFMRQEGGRFGFRMVHVGLGVFLPEDMRLNPVNTGLLTDEAVKVFKTYKLEPVFSFEDKIRYYARDRQGKIQIVNPALLAYYLDFGIDRADSREFSYVVAESLADFVASYDVSLIPDSFYEYYQRNQTFFNYSGMDIWRVRRKVFVKPYLYAYQPEQMRYELLTKDKSISNFADKIRQGENLKTTIERILKEEFKIAEPYFKVRVSRMIEFDRDRNDVLTPRIRASIFFKRLTLAAEVAKQTRRGWASLDKMVN